MEKENLLKEEEKNIEVTEVNENKEIITEEIVTEDNKEKRDGFFKKILASVADQIVVSALSLLAVVILGFILKLAGYLIADKPMMFLTMYIIMNVIYSPICEVTKLQKTIGKNIILK